MFIKWREHKAKFARCQFSSVRSWEFDREDSFPILVCSGLIFDGADNNILWHRVWLNVSSCSFSALSLLIATSFSKASLQAEKFYVAAPVIRMAHITSAYHNYYQNQMEYQRELFSGGGSAQIQSSKYTFVLAWTCTALEMHQKIPGI